MPATAFQSVPPVFDALVAYGIGGLAVFMAVVAVRLIARGSQGRGAGAAVAVAGWMAAMAGLARAGVLARVDGTPPPMAVLIPTIFIVALLLGLSPLGGRLAGAVPLATLIGFQAFRLPLELLMHRAAGLGIMPPELSYSGYNFDILTGAGALLLFVAMRTTRVPAAVLWAWNVWGLGCLVVIAGIARASSPMVRAFGDAPAHVNTWVLYFPYIWLPTVLVVLAVAGHIVTTRALLARRGD